jgi:hypothetical protein
MLTADRQLRRTEFRSQIVNWLKLQSRSGNTDTRRPESGGTD